MGWSSDGFDRHGATLLAYASAAQYPCRVSNNDPPEVRGSDSPSHCQRAGYHLIAKCCPAALKMTRDEATQRKMECDITVGPVNTVAESLADPQIHAGEMVEE